MSKKDIESFLQKSTILQQTISGLADGSLNEDQIDLREHGIYTPEQQKEEDERKAKAKKEWEAKQERKQREEREYEKKHWWDGAIHMYGPREVKGRRDVDKDIDNTDDSKRQDDSRPISEVHAVKQRYSSDYSRWNENTYQPDDEATKEEEQIKKDQLEKLQNDEFEKANKEWCEGMKQDLKKRQDGIKKREEYASMLRIKGNKLFKRKRYTDALSKYLEALEKTPYAVNVITNIALVHEKMKCWEEAIEYCDRAIHVDNNCIKALYLRHKAFIETNKEQSALDDLNRCILLDPDNEEFHVAKEKLSQKLQRDSIETEVQRVTHEKTTHEQVGCDEIDSLILDKIEFTIGCGKDDPEYDSMMKKQFRYIDECMDYFKRKSYRYKLSDILPNNPAIETDVSLLQIFVHYKLCKCPIACAYLRKSGYLSQMLEDFKSFCQSYSDTSFNNPKKEEKLNTIEIIKMISQICQIDSGTYEFVSKFGAVDFLFELFQRQLDGFDDIDLVASVGQSLATFLNGSFADESLIRRYVNNQDFVSTVCEVLKLSSDKKVAAEAFLSHCDLISSCAEMLSAICSNAKLGKQSSCSCFTGKRNAVTTLTKNMTVANPMKSTKISSLHLSNMRKSIVSTLLVFSATEDTRECFFEDGHDIGKVCSVLLALSSSFKSEIETTREMALMALTNLMTPINGKSNLCIRVGELIAARGGLETLVQLCCSEESSSMIKERASAGLSRLISLSSVKLNAEAANKVWAEFMNITSQRNWTSTATDSAVSKSTSKAASNLLKVAIASTGHILWSDCKNVQAIMKLLPKPRINSRGVVDSQSVCQPPEKAPKGSAMSFAYTTPSFCANLLKLIIHYLDVHPNHHHFVMEADGIEYLVSLLANSDHHHEAVTKNAATALARLVKTDSMAKQRCRDLRGMQILLELGQSGRI